MATQRRGTAKRASRRKPAASRRQTTRPRRPRRGSARAGTRTAQREEVARSIESGTGAPDLHVAAPLPEPVRAAEPSHAAGRAVAGGPSVPGYARLVAEQADPEAEARRRMAESELARRREEAARTAPMENVGSATDVALELAIGGLRLARTLLTAPLRIALAFLRSRDD